MPNHYCRAKIINTWHQFFKKSIKIFHCYFWTHATNFADGLLIVCEKGNEIDNSVEEVEICKLRICLYGCFLSKIQSSESCVHLGSLVMNTSITALCHVSNSQTQQGYYWKSCHKIMADFIIIFLDWAKLK